MRRRQHAAVSFGRPPCTRRRTGAELTQGASLLSFLPTTFSGAIMGLMLGATLGVDAIPEHAIKGLADYKDIAAEIDAFVSFAMSQ